MRILVTISFMVYALTFYWRAVTFEPGMTFADVALLPQFVQGLAVACFFMPLTTITLSGLPPEKWLQHRAYLISFEPLLARWGHLSRHLCGITAKPYIILNSRKRLTHIIQFPNSSSRRWQVLV